ncbi:Rrf2 family transcriptional regulator [Pseudohoeflea suaedae]|uniref:Rrf2 family transcriptional regulator n=1 Tax=Pseudohoeflea suaedae TaxID=877384 RepID=A0A4R5PNQ2_9HYPH|nr:Rrf2 family transcriptional regulator [Pseudohoeflea suaedae]TDH38666.1 Rrf2 family transcriptional regulator [Pseudohoeflea suaedae]
MKRDSRLSIVLHGLLHMQAQGKPMTSAELALCMDTNPVVVRRTMAGLRENGLVSSEKGHGGGWTIARPLAGISLLDIHESLGEPDVVGFSNKDESPGCLIERAVNRELDAAMDEMRAVFTARMRAITLADIWDSVREPFNAHHNYRKDHPDDA